MQNQTEIIKINQFLGYVSLIIVMQIKSLFQSAGFEVEERGNGLNLAFIIKSGDKTIEFIMHNLLLEIATIDRDEEPLRFDERLYDFEFFVNKSTYAVASKLRIIFKLLADKDIDTILENIAQDTGQYERLRIWRFDPKPP